MTLRDFNFYIGMLSELGEIVPLVLIFLFFLKGFKTNFRSNSLKIIVVYISLSFSLKAISMVNFFKTEDNLFIYAVLGFVEVFLLTPFFISESTLGAKFGKILLLLLVLSNGYFVINQLPGIFNSGQWTINYIVLIVLSLSFFYQFYQSAEVILPKNMLFPPAIILNFGLIFYFCGSFFVYLMAWYMLSQKAIGFFANGWIFVSLSNIVKIMFITIYFYRSFIQAKASRN
jgi:hypothetical protein